MADLKDVINEIAIDDIRYQLLTKGTHTLAVRGRKEKYLQVTFESNAEYLNQNKEAIIIWVDKDKLYEALDRVRA